MYVCVCVSVCVSVCVCQCALLESGLSEKLSLHVDMAGNLVAASLSTVLPYCSADLHQARRDLRQFNTSVDVQQTVAGPV